MIYFQERMEYTQVPETKKELKTSAMSLRADAEAA